MSRPLRLEVAGALYHVTSRGDRREDIYESDADRQSFLNVPGDVCVRYNWSCHAYCLTGNHYHKEVGEYFGLHYSAISGILTNHKSKT
jgi:putative transposase